jgi:hypothetical protein
VGVKQRLLCSGALARSTDGARGPAPHPIKKQNTQTDGAGSPECLKIKTKDSSEAERKAGKKVEKTLLLPRRERERDREKQVAVN